MHDVGLELVRSLQLLEAVPRAVEAECGLLVHEAQLGLDVRGLLIIGQRVPMLIRGSVLKWRDGCLGDVPGLSL